MTRSHRATGISCTGPAAALPVDEVSPERPLRQWMLSLPTALRFLPATRPAVLSAVLSVVCRTISGHRLTGRV